MLVVQPIVWRYELDREFRQFWNKNLYATGFK